MAKDSVTLFIQASSRQPGALGIFHAYATEEWLALCLDARVGSRKRTKKGNILAMKELRYGWLHDTENRVVDEVMLAKSGTGMRVLMVHGGRAVCEQVRRYFQKNGFVELTDSMTTSAQSAHDVDMLFEPLLAGCLTETQVATVLDARERARASGGSVHIPEAVLATHRLVLAGPPNAGKSSLLNRLAGFERAFVHEEAGATRDAVDELLDLGGYAVLLGDLPGYPGTREGMAGAAWKKAEERLRLAEAVLFVCDASRAWDADTEQTAMAIADILAAAQKRNGAACPVLVLRNKSDLPCKISGEPWLRFFPSAESMRVCSLPGGDAAEKVGLAVFRLLGAVQ